MEEIIFATKNKGKIKEIKAILADLNITVLSMEEAGIDIDIEENGETFEDNAKIKATEIMKVSGKITLADDSGLEVDYLDKQPGVYSARYMGETTSYDIKNKKIISLLEGVEEKQRTARFVSAIAAAFPDGKIFTTRATIEGMIGYEQKGENGFGYDPIFYVPEYRMTTAEMPPELKNKISHRGKALQLMKQKLIEELEEKSKL